MAWWLAHEELNGTMNETYPIKDPLTDKEVNDIYQYHYPGIDDGYPSEFTTLSDNDDQIAHHIDLDKEIDRVEYKLNNEVQKQGEEKPMANYFKYHEEEILKDIEDYVSATYRGHYSTNQFQSTEFIIDCGHGEGFMLGNIIKYAQRYGKKGTHSDARKDLLKIVHYAIIALHNHDEENGY